MKSRFNRVAGPVGKPKGRERWSWQCVATACALSPGDQVAKAGAAALGRVQCVEVRAFAVSFRLGSPTFFSCASWAAGCQADRSLQAERPLSPAPEALPASLAPSAPGKSTKSERRHCPEGNGPEMDNFAPSSRPVHWRPLAPQRLRAPESAAWPPRRTVLAEASRSGCGGCRRTMCGLRVCVVVCSCVAGLLIRWARV